MLSQDQKLILVQHVLAKKDILFAKHSPTVTNKIKDKHWLEIYEDLVAHGAQVKNPEYLRKTEWGNLKQRTVEKYVESKKSGASDFVLSQTQKLVMETVGYDSITVKDMSVNLGKQSRKSKARPKEPTPSTSTNLPSTLELNGAYYQSDNIEVLIDEESSIDNAATVSQSLREDLVFPSTSRSGLGSQDVALEDLQSQVETPAVATPAPNTLDGQRAAGYIRPNTNPTAAQIRNAANKRSFLMLTDEDFLADKKKKLFLEIEEMERQSEARERKEKLEEELTQAQIDELKAPKEFFVTLTDAIKKKMTAALLNECFSED